MKKYQVNITVNITYELDSSLAKHAINHAIFLAGRDAEKIKLVESKAKVIGEPTEDLEDLS